MRKLLEYGGPYEVVSFLTHVYVLLLLLYICLRIIESLLKISEVSSTGLLFFGNLESVDPRVYLQILFVLFCSSDFHCQKSNLIYIDDFSFF